MGAWHAHQILIDDQLAEVQLHSNGQKMGRHGFIALTLKYPPIVDMILLLFSQNQCSPGKMA